MKQLFILFLFSALAATSSAQADQIFNNQPCNSYECQVYDIWHTLSNTLETIYLSGQTITLSRSITGEGDNLGEYTKVVFVEQGKSLTTRSQMYTTSSLMKQLERSGLVEDCQFKQEQLDTFIEEHHEQIEENLSAKEIAFLVQANTAALEASTELEQTLDGNSSTGQIFAKNKNKWENELRTLKARHKVSKTTKRRQ
ncbi:MAG: hypothetical protein AAFV80_10635 [Bacteroidota bacterium]